MTRPARLPVTVVTGALGSGKTTLVNHLIRHGGRRLAVIVNEFGQIGIDGALIDSGREELIELSSGCICCVVRGDLIRTLRRLDVAADAVVIETTGLADPGPVIQTFLADQQLAGRYVLDTVVTVVDALHGAQALEAADMQAQVALASVLLLNKASEAADTAALEARLRALNPHAALHRIDRGRADPALVLDTQGFALERIGGLPATPPAHDHGPGGIHAVSLTGGTLDAARVEAWLSALLQVHGADILRTKGVLRVAGDPRPLVVQAVHMMLEGDFLDGRATPEESRIVFIGRHLDEPALRAGFAGCAVQPSKGDRPCPSS